MALPNSHCDDDGDVVMVPISSTIEHLAGSLRQLREDIGEVIRDAEMTDAFDHSSFNNTGLEASVPLRLLAIDTNILIGHLSLLEWVGDLLVTARRMGIGSGYCCGLLIPKMVRAEIDKHKMPHNKQRMITAMIEPSPRGTGSGQDVSVHSPEFRQKMHHITVVDAEAVRISLAEAADYAVNWMARLYHGTPPEYCVLKFQTKDQVADPSFSRALRKTNELMSPDSHILDCTIYFKRILEASGGGIMLMTNDKALSLEAELEGIQTLRVQPGLTCASLLRMFDPVVADHIDRLVDEVSFPQMTMFNIYKTRCRSRTGVQARLPHLSSQNPSRSNKKLLTATSQGPMTGGSLETTEGLLHEDEPMEETVEASLDTSAEPTGLFREKSEQDENMLDVLSPPLFPVIHETMLVIPMPSPFNTLLELHEHISTSVATLLRKPLFDHISSFDNLKNLNEVYQMCTNALDRRQLGPILRDPNDATQWSASDCLVLIDECWVDGCFRLFDKPNKSSRDALRNLTTTLAPHPTSKTSLQSRWAPTSAKPISLTIRPESSDQQPLSRLRKTIQVLESQLRLFVHTQLPRDNPTSWSLLLWESLLEDIERVLIAGRFEFSIQADQPGASSRDSLDRVIRTWTCETRRLCQWRSINPQT